MRFFRNLSQFRFSLHQGWGLFFCLWTLLLTGSFEWFRPQHKLSPGIQQAWQLKSYLSKKETQLLQLEAEITQLKTQSELLVKNSFAQEQEIRKVLGYVASDEIIFDLSYWDSKILEPLEEKAKEGLPLKAQKRETMNTSKAKISE